MNLGSRGHNQSVYNISLNSILNFEDCCKMSRHEQNNRECSSWPETSQDEEAGGTKSDGSSSQHISRISSSTCVPGKMDDFQPCAPCDSHQVTIDGSAGRMAQDEGCLQLIKEGGNQFTAPAWNSLHIFHAEPCQGFNYWHAHLERGWY